MLPLPWIATPFMLKAPLVALIAIPPGGPSIAAHGSGKQPSAWRTRFSVEVTPDPAMTMVPSFGTASLP